MKLQAALQALVTELERRQDTSETHVTIAEERFS